VLGFEAGSKELKELEEKIKFYDSQVHDVPIIVGDEEIRTKAVRHQVRVRTRFTASCFCKIKCVYHSILTQLILSSAF
jgi:hypothetical protein